MTRLRVWKEDGEDISEEVYLQNGCRLPTGWSSHEVHWNGHIIGHLYCGEPRQFVDGYRAIVEVL